MRGKFIALLAVTVIATGAFAFFGDRRASAKDDPVAERQIDANHMQVRIDGKWQDVPMIALADNLCQSRRPQFRKYCR